MVERNGQGGVSWKTRLLQGTAEDEVGAARAETWRSLATPVYRGSTVVFPGSAAVREGARPEVAGWTYGLYGTPTTEELARRVKELEGGCGTVLVPSGQAAIALVNLALLRSGDHVLLPHNAYGPSVRLAHGLMQRMGVEAECYRATEVEDLRRRLRARTRLVWCESPGSITMEVQDVPAIAAAAHGAGALVAADTTWSAGVLWDAFGHGVDVSAQALTKYVGGHSDVLLGSVTARDGVVLEEVATVRRSLGIGVSPDECSLALRGLLTMGVRLEAVERSALHLARWLAGRPEVERVLHPAMESCPGHAVWKRDYMGANGLFSFVLREGTSLEAARAVVDGLRLFQQGWSWGGVHSLAMQYDLREREERFPPRTEEERYGWRLIRLHVGLEAVEDLRADLRQALDRLAAG